MTFEPALTTAETFFASYRRAFERRDIAAIEEHFGDGVHIATLACEDQRWRIIALAHDEIAQVRRSRGRDQETVDRGSS